MSTPQLLFYEQVAPVSQQIHADFCIDAASQRFEFARHVNSVPLTGFMAVDRGRLKELSGEKLAELAKTDELELTYTHLQSMNNFSEMLKRASDHPSRSSKPNGGEEAGGEAKKKKAVPKRAGKNPAKHAASS